MVNDEVIWIPVRVLAVWKNTSEIDIVVRHQNSRCHSDRCWFFSRGFRWLVSIVTL